MRWKIPLLKVVSFLDYWKSNSIGLTFDKTMESAPKKYKSSLEGTNRDRLSDLPDEILVHILSFMPILDAVRTVLIRRLGNLWTMVHTLHFEDTEDTKHPTSVSFSDFVRNVLFFHRRPTIEKFHLDIYEALPVIEMWIRFAQSKEAKTLKLNNFPYYYDFYTLPRCVFAGQTLVSLKIVGCKIEHQSGVLHMGSLRKLKIIRCSVRNEALEELISGCPSLEKLEICCPSELDNLCVTSPSIKSIHLIGWGSAKIDCSNLKTLDICASVDALGVIDVSSVSEANINLHGSPSQKSANVLLSLLKKIENAEILTLSPDTIQHLAYCSVKGLAFPHNKWKYLTLDVWFHETRMQGICNFIRNSPSLEELTVSADEEFRSVKALDIFDNNLLVQELSSPCVMPQLRTVTMYGFGKSYQAQLQLAEFLLKSAVNLEKLLLVSYFPKQIALSEEHNAFFKQLSSFQRASTNARVVFSAESCGP